MRKKPTVTLEAENLRELMDLGRQLESMKYALDNATDVPVKLELPGSPDQGNPLGGFALKHVLPAEDVRRILNERMRVARNRALALGVVLR